MATAPRKRKVEDGLLRFYASLSIFDLSNRFDTEEKDQSIEASQELLVEIMKFWNASNYMAKAHLLFKCVK